MGYQKEEVYDGNDGDAHVVQVYRRLDCRCVANTTTFLSIKLENIMVESNDLVTIETETHMIEVSDGWLTIGTKHFPDNCVSLTPEETKEVLKVLLRWREDSTATRDEQK